MLRSAPRLRSSTRRPWRAAPLLAAGSLALFVGFALVSSFGAGSRGGGTTSASAQTPLHALLLGGGPDAESNTAEIESHVRFVANTLPVGVSRIVLFADGGKSGGATVRFTDSAKLNAGRRALDVLLPGRGFGAASESRRPNLGDAGVKCDGAARRRDLRGAIGTLAAQLGRAPAAAVPVLIYVAGHGTHNDADEENNSYDLWGDDALTVRALAGELARLPAGAPVVLVMAQCYSGAFANVLFRGGDGRGGAPVERDIAAFFSATKDREAAGCGTETDAADYQDFSSYFFGALSGRDRVGNGVAGADYDGDGRVSLHEAFCYALIHDESIDTPTCGSDAFLRRFVPLPDAEIFLTPFAATRAAATPAERAALDALSERLELHGEARSLAAHDRLQFGEPAARSALVEKRNEASRRLEALRQDLRAALFARWPALRWTDSPDYDAACAGALLALDETPAQRDELLAAQTAYQRADDALDVDEAFLLRFTQLCARIVRAERLRQGKSADRALVTRFERLRQAEDRSLPLRRNGD